MLLVVNIFGISAPGAFGIAPTQLILLALI